jgi:hypothetical protein
VFWRRIDGNYVVGREVLRKKKFICRLNKISYLVFLCYFDLVMI